MGPKKNKAAVRSQKEDSQVKEVVRGQPLSTKETGVMTTTKENAALGTQK
jgi:hypothetical protein